MKTIPILLKNFLVFLFFIFTSITFGQTTDTYTASGSWTVPTGVTSVTVEIWGAGGGGGGSNTNATGGSGGGSGAYVTKTMAVIAGTNYTFTIGAGGAGGGANGANGANGTDSTINFGGVISAGGGTGGSGNAGAVGAGGTASGGTNTNGNPGILGGASGGKGGSAPNGGTGGAGGTDVAGSNGNTPGGGGGGGEKGTKNRGGGGGARGEIRFTYIVPGAYCIPTNASSTSYYISGITSTGGVTNFTNTGTGFSAYTNYSATKIVSQYAGSNFSLTATHPSSTYGYTVWIDWNSDSDFNDPGETVISTSYLATPANLGNVTIPLGQAPGNYRMRIRNAYLSNPAPACGEFGYGEAEDYTVSVIIPSTCTGTPVAGTTITSPGSGTPGSSYVVSASGYTNATGLTFQWQFSTNGGSTWTNQGAATGTYSNYTATAPALGTTVLWHLVVTCVSSGQSATSTNGTFTSVNTQNIPTTGNITVTCGTNIVLYDNGGNAGNYANGSSGYAVLDAGLGATITISGNYVTESSFDYIRIYNGTGTGGTLLASYSGTGSINYTGTAGQTLTVQFYSDSSTVYAGFSLSITYSGTCYPVCSGTPTGGTVTTSPNTIWPGNPYTVSASGFTQAVNILYQWQYSINAGATWTNAGSATSTYANYNAIAPASGVVQWRLVVTCTNSGQVATSTNGTFTTMVVSNVLTGCPNVVSGGLGLNGADPATINCTATSTCVNLEATYLDLGETTDYIVEAIAYNPPRSFSGLANPISVNTDDVYSPIVNLPFDFCFYGNKYTQCVIGSNGILTFNTSLAGASSGYSFNSNIPISGDTVLRENSIFGVLHDINPGVGTTKQVGWELITLPTGCRALVASWYDVPMFDENSQLYTGMMVLYENSNIIEVYIKNKEIDNFGAGTWNGGNAIVGIQNATGTIASVAPGRNGLDPNWSATNEAWRFVPNGNSIASIKWYEGPTASGPVIGTNDTLTVCPAATTTYTAEITYTLCDGRTIKKVDQTTVTINGAKTWNGSVSTNWNVPNNWTPVGVPTAMDCVVIADTANDPIISGTNYNGLGLNLTVNNNATLTVTPNNDLTITKWVNINPTGDLVLQNSASLIQIDNDVNQGTMHMTRTANIRKLDYVYWSSPVTSFASSAISPGTPTSYIYKWTPTIPTNTNFFGNWVNGNEIMALGKGYIVRGPDSFTSTVASFNTIFTGTPNNGIITTPIARGSWNGGTYSTGVSTTLGTNDDDNWNLIGNPYPSAVRAIDFLTLNTNIDGFIKIWTHGTLPSTAIADPFYNNYVYNYTPGDYITYNSSGTSSGPGVFNGNIAAGQGFFVLMKHTSLAASENVTFNNSMRSSTYDNAQFFRTSNENGRIWLDLVASNGTNIRNLVAYTDGASNDRDRLYDAITDEKLNLNLYSLIGETPMTIQGRTLPFDQNDRVPMGVKIPQDGNYSIAIGIVDGFFTDENQEIYLEDKATNVIHNLRDAPYNFTSVAGNHTNRFILRYTNETLGNDDVISDEANLWVISSDILSVKSTKNEIQSVRVFDVLGRHLAYYPNVDGYEVPLNTIQKNNAGLIIQVTLSNGTVVSKKAIY